MKPSTQTLMRGLRRHAIEYIGRTAYEDRGSAERCEFAVQMRLFHGQPATPDFPHINREVHARMIAQKGE